MSDAVVTSIVTGMVTVVVTVVGFLTLWVKLKYGEGKADALAAKAVRMMSTTKTSRILAQVDFGMEGCSSISSPSPSCAPSP